MVKQGDIEHYTIALNELEATLLRASMPYQHHNIWHNGFSVLIYECWGTNFSEISLKLFWKLFYQNSLPKGCLQPLMNMNAAWYTWILLLWNALFKLRFIGWYLMSCLHLQMSINWCCVHCSEVFKAQFDGLVQDCSNSIANALELLQSCTKATNLCFFMVAISRQAKGSRYLQFHWCTSGEVSTA